MARPLKTGLDYFPLDCVTDEKIEALESEYGIEGFGVWVRLMQSIYRTDTGEINLKDNGFSMWKILGKRCGKDEEYLRKVIGFMVDIGIFNKQAFKKDSILTSNGIKKRVAKINLLREKDRERKEGK